MRAVRGGGVMAMPCARRPAPSTCSIALLAKSAALEGADEAAAMVQGGRDPDDRTAGSVRSARGTA